MTLLERHTQLAELAAANRDAAAGRGGVAIVTGSAGVGKTALVRRFATTSNSRVLWGLCDDLVTPRPLGPFRDMFAAHVAQPDLSSLLDLVLDELSRPPHPACAVIDDAHWADEATLDAIRFIGRRISRLRALMVITYRDDEVPAGHPLRQALGAIPSDDTRRIQLRPLSREAVARLCGAQEADRIYRLTGGNPFFVHELMAAPHDGVPATIQDAVMARVGRLEPMAASAIEVVSVVPGRAENWLVDGCDAVAGIEAAARTGVVTIEDGYVAFANELARRAVESSLPEPRRVQANQRVLDVLVGRETVDPARLAHHAARAGDGAAVARFAPAAARRAAALKAHRAAAAHYEQALDYADRFSRAELANLYEQHARESRVIAQHEAALGSARRALELTDSNPDDRCRRLCLLAEIYVLLGWRSSAEQAAQDAVEAIKDRPRGLPHAGAFAERARLAMMRHRPAEALEYGTKAHELMTAEGAAAGDIAQVEVTLAVARWQLDDDRMPELVQCLDASVASGATFAAARAYVNLAYGNTQLMRYDDALAFIEDGLAFCQDVEQLVQYGYLMANRAQVHFEQCRWAEAERDVIRALEITGSGHTRVTCLCVRGLIQARRGEFAAAAGTLAEARAFAESTGVIEGSLRTWAAMAELAHLTRSPAPDPASVVDLVHEGGAWSRGAQDCARWLARAGVIDEPPRLVAGPRALQVFGRHAAAADAFDVLGRPYDAADARADTGRPEDLLEALEVLDRLGAAGKAAWVRDRLAELGVPGVPRGPRRTTRSNPAGLTPRQSEILALLAADLTYQEIADRLHLSIKTVDHHVSAVRSKLAVHTRDDAVAAGRRLGIVDAEHRAASGQT